jgi:hypothetical protein
LTTALLEGAGSNRRPKASRATRWVLNRISKG